MSTTRTEASGDVEGLVERLREESARLQGVAWGRADGGQECGISANLADEAADLITRLQAHIAGEGERCEAAVREERERCAGIAEGRSDGENDAGDAMRVGDDGQEWCSESSYGAGRSDAATAILSAPAPTSGGA